MSDLTGPQLVKPSQALVPKINRKEPFPPGTPAYTGRRPLVLLVLDGWGIGPKTAGNAIELAETPTMESLWLEYPHTELGASGEAVGLPAGVDGNSETGHMNIGAGKVIQQNLPRVNTAIESGVFFQNEVLLTVLEKVKETGGTLHLMGLVGPGLVHSSVQHLEALLQLAKKHNISQVAIHAFTDGRDSSPTAGLGTLERIEAFCADLGVGKLSTIMGRFYGMDRDRNWDRTQKAYDALTLGEGQVTTDWYGAVQQSYEKQVTDEFLEPIVITQPDGKILTVEENDAVIFFNFRVDRPRQLAWAFALPDFEYRDLTGASSGQALDQSQLVGASVLNFVRKKKYNDLYFVIMTDYDKDLMVPKVFPREDISMNLGRVFSEAGARQLRLTETEKEKMVTYYIDGKQEDPYPGEHWLIFPSKKTRSYADIPEMTAREITEALVQEIEAESFDIAVVNICNGDMVGHTGNLPVSIQACEIVDQQIKKIVDAILKTNGVLVITADHGNVEEMIDNQTGEIDTAHSIYPVPCIFVAKELRKKLVTLPTGVLADVAPTLIALAGLKKPEEMTGKSLLQFEE